MERVTITVHHFMTAVTVVLTLTALIIASIAVSGNIDWKDNSIPDTAIKVQDQNMDLGLFLKTADSSFFNATAVQIEDGGLAAVPASTTYAVHYSDLKHLRGHNAEVTSSGAHTVVDEDGLALKSGSGKYTLLKAFNSLAPSYTLTLPADAGTADQVLKTDGNGNLRFDHGNNSSFSTDYLTSGSNALSISIPNTISIGNTGNTDFTLSSGRDIDMDSSGNIILDADGDNIYFKFGGSTGQMQVTNENSGDVVIRSLIDGKDLVFKQSDGTETLRLTDTAEVEVKDNLHLKSDSAVLYFGADSEYSITHANNNGLTFTGPILTTSTTDDYALKLTQTLNNALGAGATEVYTMLEANLTETDASGWAKVYLMDLQVGGTSKFSVNNSGNTTVAGTMDVSGILTALTLTVTGEATFQSHINLGDSNNLNMGSNSDLQIGHNSMDSYITNATGDLNIQSGTGDINIIQSGTGDLNIHSGTGDINIQSGTGDINISTVDYESIVNIGTGGAKKTCTIGSINGESMTTIQSGSGSIIFKSSSSDTSGNPDIVTNTQPDSDEDLDNDTIVMELYGKGKSNCVIRSSDGKIADDIWPGWSGGIHTNDILFSSGKCSTLISTNKIGISNVFAGDPLVPYWGVPGNVSPQVELDVNGVARVSRLGVRTQPLSLSENTVDIAIGDYDTGFKQEGDGVLAIRCNNIEQVRINPSVTGRGCIDVKGLGAGQSVAYGYLNNSGATGTGGGNIQYAIYADGKIAAVEFNAVSDDRLKIQEEYITNATDTLMKLRPQNYYKKRKLETEFQGELDEWNTKKSELRDKIDVIENIQEADRTEEQISNLSIYNDQMSKLIEKEPKNGEWLESGLIAQEVFYDTPELRHIVTTGMNPGDISETPPEGYYNPDPSIDPDYSNWGETPANLKYNNFIAYLIKGFQEQQAIITDLQTRINNLENTA